MKELIRIRKELRKEFQVETNYYNNKKIMERIKMIKERIVEKQKESRENKIHKIADQEYSQALLYLRYLELKTQSWIQF